MIELNKIYNEDNMLTMSKIENLSIDYCLTSPPYNCIVKNKNKYIDFHDNYSMNDYFEQQKNLISELLRITKNHVFYNIQMVSGNKVALNKLIGHFAENIKEIIIWDKQGQPAINPKVFNSSFEFIIIFSNNEPGKRYFSDANFERGTQKNIFKIKNSHSNPFADLHQAIMPLDIPRYFMQNFGKENDIWFDPYSGMATTAIGAIKENRRFIGSEISNEYWIKGNERIKNELNQLSLF